jgi:hypothetical protein
VRGDDLTLALIEMRQASARERLLAARARQSRLSAGRAERPDAGARRVRVWVRTSWHTLPGHRTGDRTRG